MLNTVDEICSIFPADLAAPCTIRAPEHPVEMRLGRGISTTIPSVVVGPALVVASHGSIRRSGLAPLIESQTNWHTYTRVPPNPTPAVINAGARIAHDNSVQTIIGLGGGSVMDAARCIATMHDNNEDITSLQEHIRATGKVERKVRLIQIPTTAGTGSEVTPWASVWDCEGKKSSLDHPCSFADVAIIDPALTDTMPSRLTASVGLDAMAHAMESIWGRHADSISDQYATRALQLVSTYLIDGIKAPCPTTRNALSLAATLAGLALTRCRSAIAHALSYELTGQYNIEHGLAVGLLCRATLPFQREEVPLQVERILRATGTDSTASLQKLIRDVLTTAGLETGLTSYGVPPSAFSAIAQAAIESNRLQNTVGDWSRDRLIEVLTSVA